MPTAKDPPLSEYSRKVAFDRFYAGLTPDRLIEMAKEAARQAKQDGDQRPFQAIVEDHWARLRNQQHSAQRKFATGYYDR